MVRRIALLSLVTALAVFVTLPASARAATQVLTVTPSSTRPTVSAGASQTGSFQVINQGEAAYNVKLYTTPYSVKTENYTPDFIALPGRPNASSWLHLDATNTTIKPDQTLTVGYTISVPAGTEPGGYYAVAFAETQAPETGRGVVVNERVGEIFYIEVAGSVTKSGKVLSWSSSFLQSSPVQATLRLENDGGADYRSDINVSVEDLFGNTKFSFQSSKAVLPQTIRQIPISWDKAPAIGLFKISGTATVFGETHKLPTKYVLVASRTTRIVFLAIILLVIAWFGGRTLATRKRARNLYRRPKD